MLFCRKHTNVWMTLVPPAAWSTLQFSFTENRNSRSSRMLEPIY